MKARPFCFLAPWFAQSWLVRKRRLGAKPGNPFVTPISVIYTRLGRWSWNTNRSTSSSAHRLIIYCVPCQDGGSHALRAMATEISAHHAAMCAQPPDGGQAWYEPNPGGTLDLIPHFVVEYRPTVLRGAMGI